MLFTDDFTFVLRNSSVIYYVYFSNRVMIQFNKYLRSAHCVGHREGVWPGPGKGKGSPQLRDREAGLGADYPRAAHPLPSAARGQVAGLSWRGNPRAAGPAPLRLPGGGASAHPDAGSRVALLALLAATG